MRPHRFRGDNEEIKTRKAGDGMNLISTLIFIVILIVILADLTRD